jgi:hypothetical protein
VTDKGLNSTCSSREADQIVEKDSIRTVALDDLPQVRGRQRGVLRNARLRLAPGEARLELLALDPQHLFFTQSDLADLNAQLDAILKNLNTHVNGSLSKMHSMKVIDGYPYYDSAGDQIKAMERMEFLKL